MLTAHIYFELHVCRLVGPCTTLPSQYRKEPGIYASYPSYKHSINHIQLATNLQSRPQTPPSYEEKRSGELSQISWASAHFCHSVTQQRLKHLTSKRYRCSSRDKNVAVVRKCYVLSCNLFKLSKCGIGGGGQAHSRHALHMAAALALCQNSPGWHWLDHFSPCQHKQVQKPLLSSCRDTISGSVGSFQSDRWPSGRRSLTVECSLMSGCG